jgi:flagellar biosynthesis/type III secretory pathway protein FliH
MTFNQIWDVLAEERAEGYEEGREEGMEKGMEKGAREVIASLIRHLPDANDETIANLSSKPAEYVAQVRREMNAPDA